MITALSGTITSIQQDSLDINVQGVQYQLAVPTSHAFIALQSTTIITYLHWNQENGPQLYGFCSVAQRHLFILLISCNGIGPRVALAILSELSISEFLEAVQTNNDQTISKVNGIGRKKAEQLIVQLKHKINTFIEQFPDTSSSGSAALHTVGQALESLNYSKQEVSRAIHHIRSLSPTTTASFDILMKQALMFLSKQ